MSAPFVGGKGTGRAPFLTPIVYHGFPKKSRCFWLEGKEAGKREASTGFDKRHPLTIGKKWYTINHGGRCCPS